MIWLLLVLGPLGWSQELKKRFEFEYSFKGPYIAQMDGKVNGHDSVFINLKYIIFIVF